MLVELGLEQLLGLFHGSIESEPALVVRHGDTVVVNAGTDEPVSHGLHRLVDTFRCSQRLWKLALVDIVVRAARLGKYWKIAFPLSLNDAMRAVNRGPSVIPGRPRGS